MDRYTRSNGHAWRWGSWWCYEHDQRCDPLTPVDLDDIVEKAAKDQAVDDDTFVVLSQALRRKK